VPKTARLRIRDRLAAMNMTRDDRMPKAAKAILLERLGPEIERLGPMIGRDLNGWLE
jgi:hypothetical protein